MNAYSAYKNQQQQNQPPAKIVAKLLQKAAHLTSQAAEADKNDILDERYNLTQRAVDILEGLRGCLLDTPETQEMTTMFRNFYVLMEEFICFFNVRRDQRYAQAVVKSLNNLAEAWLQVDEAMNDGSLAAHATLSQAAVTATHQAKEALAANSPTQESSAIKAVQSHFV